ncbi:hypothetical protein U0C82_00135 [Fulvimarina sp. 2208YS6-2-32]|uniref:Uncharacterized protein n=1 Tax=Fulvimarina uroteuthidis TaxID=3098149 RepID=A0ABU5HWP2_9HYPH|nr:hypothetical protein [Fulvimarina sp. 2208YS6-2-32]MDY8107554.1 hypothetical protein [Fulvimarina sp. 2208YS6-2-32]
MPSLAVRLAAGLVALGLGMSSGAAEPVSGWSAGPDEDATMAVGQIHRCDGPECLGGFSCLYAAAPPRPPASRWLKPEDVSNPKVWPWRSVETWMGTKLNEMASNPIEDPSLPVSEWSARDEPVVFEIKGEAFARRVYSPYVNDRDLTVPIWFWTSGGRLFTMFCAIDGMQLSEVREPIHALLSELHPGEKIRDDIPKHF